MIAIIALAFCALTLAALDPFDDRGVSVAAATVLFAIGLWSGGLLPEPLTALAFFAICMVGGVAPPETTFAGFSSNAFWLVFGGLAIGAAIRESGLADRVARRIEPALRGGYARAALGLGAMGLALAFVMPATMGRIAILIPIAASIADRLGHSAGRGRTGLLLAVLFATFLPAFGILPANVPPIVLAGASEAIYGVAPAYGPYLALHFPVLGAMKFIIVVICIVAMFHTAPTGASAAPAPLGPLTAQERRVAALLIVTVAFWSTDALHGVSPAWVSLIAGFLCLTPGLGFGPPDGLRRIEIGPLLFVAGIVSLGAVASATGLGAALADAALAVVPLSPNAPAASFATLTALSATLGAAATVPGAPAILTPLSADLADAAGWTLEAVLMVQVVGFSTVFLPYQAPPLVVGAQLARLRQRDVIRLCLAVSVCTMLLLWPLDYLWWRLLGVI